MKNHTIVILIAALLLAIGAFSQPALAQTAGEPTGFKNVTLWIYPEYDDPRLLVMLQGQITGAEAPARVRFLVPAAAEMYSAGSMDAQNQYSGGPPDRQASQIQGWDEISYELKTNTFRVEYYDPVITSEANKQISYDFQSLYPISNLKVVVQEPKKSSNFGVTPDGTTGSEGGFSVHNFSYNDVTLEDTLHFDINYTKTDPNPSVENVGNPIPTGDTGNQAGTWILIAVGVVVLAGAGMFIVKSRKQPAYAKKAPARNPQSRVAENGNYKARFCNQCGSPTGKSTKFCSNCGHKLKPQG